MIFYVGTIEPHWLRRSHHPLMVSQRRLRRRWPTLPATSPWVMDSGGFTELSMHGRWTISPKEYADIILRAADTLGSLRWAAPQDWMCEPPILAKTGGTVRQHQQRTIESVHTLRALVGEDGPAVIPVLQGWGREDYLRHVDDYERAGISLREEPTVGLGSVCRRQATGEIEAIVSDLHDELGTRLHGFGVKVSGLARYGSLLRSADSMAWSYAGRRDPNPAHGHRSCAHCFRWAMEWADDITSRAVQQRFVYG